MAGLILFRSEADNNQGTGCGHQFLEERSQCYLTYDELSYTSPNLNVNFVPAIQFILDPLHLSADPLEEKPGRWKRTDPVPAQLIQLSRTDPDPAGIPSEYREGMLITAPKVAPRVDEETLKKLKALGYAE